LERAITCAGGTQAQYTLSKPKILNTNLKTLNPKHGCTRKNNTTRVGILARLVAVESPGHQLSAQPKKSSPDALGADISHFPSVQARPCTLKCGMANQERTHGSNLARLVAIESPGHQLSAQPKKSAPDAPGADISRTFRPYKQHTPMHVEVRHGQSKENARFKPRALGGNRKPWSPAICAIKEISAACTGRRDIAILVSMT